MKNLRAVITRAGGPEVLSFVEEAAPEPARGEVRLRIRAVGVAFADVYSRLVIAQVLPLGEIARAHAILESGGAVGKIVLTVD